MKWKILLFVFLLAAAAVSIAATSISTVCSNSMNSFDLSNLLLDGGFTPTGGGDALPGGGIPT
ncbi:MAG: hypothetical protein NWE91_00100 [Candidatus Bathyarchaeota archaeon]|nr:hypothetical protein [Candidatus Bathyarchaeota archaeon]